MSAVSVAPAFFPEDERWVRTATDKGSILEEQSRLAARRAKMELVFMLRTCVAEVWRHQLEREQGEAALFATITNQRAIWINEVGFRSTPEPRKPTRWQETAKLLFSLLLFPNDEEFDMKNEAHLAKLARLMHKAQQDKDEQLHQIIRYFFRVM